MARDGERQPAAPRTRRAPALEWTLGAVGLVLVIAAIALLAWKAIVLENDPPALEITTTGIERRGDRYLVRFRVENRGGRTAARLEVEGALRDAYGTVESAHTVLDYVPPGSSAEGGLFFSRDPRAHDLRIRPLGYASP